MKGFLTRMLLLTGSFAVSVLLMLAASVRVPTQTEQTMRLQEATSRPFWVMERHPMAPLLWSSSLPFSGLALYQIWKILGDILDDEPALAGLSAMPAASFPSGVTAPPVSASESLPISAPASPAVSVPTVTPQGSYEQRRQALWQLLQHRKRLWVAQCLQSQLLIWGPQGSKKTVFAAFLLLCRMILLGHRAEICDPHYHLNTDKWPEFIPAYGRQRDYRAIADRLKAYYHRLDTATPDKLPYSVVWDEVTQYEENLKPFGGADGFLKSVCSDTRKSREYPILISHDDTLAVLAGSKGGVHKMKVNGLITIFLGATRNALGEPVPTHRGTVRGLDCSQPGRPQEIPIQLEEWMSPTFLLQLFPELTQQSNGMLAVQPDVTTGERPPLAADRSLEQSFQERLHAEGTELTPPLRAILDYFYKHPGRRMKVRDIQMATLPVLQEHRMKAAEIQLCLETLTNEGFLVFDTGSNSYSLLEG
jgi:hypothetical protein